MFIWAATVTQEIKWLFSDISLTAGVLLLLGVMLLAVEFCQSMHAVASGCGAAVAVCGIVLGMLPGGGEGTLYLLVSAFLFCVYAAHVVMLAVFKRDWLRQSAYLKVARATEEKPLLEAEGVAETDFEPFGRVSVDGRQVFARAYAHIKAGETVKITRAVGNRIYVERI